MVFIIAYPGVLRINDQLVNYGRVKQLTMRFVYTTSGAVFRKHFIDQKYVVLVQELV
jgi:hypothetical protein